MFFSLINKAKGHAQENRKAKTDMKDGTHRTSNSNHSIETLEAVKPSLASGTRIDFDPLEFVHFLEETGWSDDEKIEYATLVWNIVCEFVAMGFEVHPLQQAQNSSGKLHVSPSEAPAERAEMVDSSYGQLVNEFMRSDAATAHQGEKESLE